MKNNFCRINPYLFDSNNKSYLLTLWLLVGGTKNEVFQYRFKITSKTFKYQKNYKSLSHFCFIKNYKMYLKKVFFHSS